MSPLNSRQRFGASGALIFDRLADAIAAAPLAHDRHRALRARVLARAGCTGSGVTVRANEGEWHEIAAGVTIKLLRTDTPSRRMTAYIRMQPGSSLEPHTHEDAEECLLLEGEIRIGGHRLVAGDLHVAAAGTTHPAIYSPRGALLLVHARNCLAT